MPGFRQLSPAFASLRQLSPAFASFRQLSPAFASFRQLSPRRLGLHLYKVTIESLIGGAADLRCALRERHDVRTDSGFLTENVEGHPFVCSDQVPLEFWPIRSNILISAAASWRLPFHSFGFKPPLC